MVAKDNLRKLINNYYRRLQKLKEKEALYGVSVDPGILLEIEDIEAKISGLQDELAQQEDQVEILLQPPSNSAEELETNTPAPIHLIPSYRKLTLPRPNPALRDLRRWLLGK